MGIHAKEVAAVAVDTWGAEVLPTETKDVSMPMHIILIVHMGLTLGEIFDLEALATAIKDLVVLPENAVQLPFIQDWLADAQDLTDLENFEATFRAEGYRGVAVWCQDCAEDHFYPWDMLREMRRAGMSIGSHTAAERPDAPAPPDGTDPTGGGPA